MSDPTPSLEGATFIVTGGSMGIGLAVAEHIGHAGGRVVMFARGPERLRQAAASVADRCNTEVLPVSGDVSESRDVDHLFEAAERFGSLQGVVHCAAILGPIGPVVDLAPESWLETVRINLFGSFLVAQAACRKWIAARKNGSIVLMSGGGAGSGFPNFTAYACSKVGVVRFVESVAAEVAPFGIRINCVGPGFVATRMQEQTLAAGASAGAAYLEKTRSELATGGVPPSVAARTAAFLLSERSAGITGRFVAAPHDDWEHWPDHLDEIERSDLFTLRRIVPRDRGMNWQ